VLTPAIAAAASAVVAAIYRLKREKIRADRDRALAELALRDAEPAERCKIIESLAKTKHFSHISLPLGRGRGARQAADEEAA
jgi:hypothetical protein